MSEKDKRFEFYVEYVRPKQVDDADATWHIRSRADVKIGHKAGDSVLCKGMKIMPGAELNKSPAKPVALCEECVDRVPVDAIHASATPA